MKLITNCSICFKETQIFTNIKDMELNDDNVYQLECEKGHKYLCFCQEQQFEVLFELGALALLDGYTREAVSNIAVALERFYEFCIQILLTHKGIQYDQFEASWKLVSAQSERQIGAFIFLYLSEFLEVPKMAENKKEFRNKVTHKGHIPNFEAAKDYMGFIYNYILEIWNTIKARISQETIGSVITRNQQKNQQLKEKYGPDNWSVFGGISSVISIGLADEILFSRTFDTALLELKERREKGLALQN